MFLALREIRRAPVRFGLLAVSIGLLLFLVLFQQSLQQGLLTSFVGAIRNQGAPVLVYGVDAQRTLQGSVLTAELEEQVLAVDGIGEHVRIGETTVAAEVGGEEQTDVTVIGSDGELGQPAELADGRRPAAPGEAIGSSLDFTVGDRVVVLAGAEEVALEVVGVADDVQLSVSPTLFTDFATYEDIVRAVNPDAPAVPASALGLAPSEGVAPAVLAERINAEVADAEAVTREEAADTTPSVVQVRQSFQVIFALYAVVVPLVTGLFFLIVTLQKARSLVLLRAIGARTAVLTRALVAQVLIITGCGLVVGIVLTWPLAGRRVGGLTLRFDPASIATWAVAFLVLSVLGALVSLLRVRRIDPVQAATTGSAA
jgi:putative ABC transport system permease protein